MVACIEIVLMYLKIQACTFVASQSFRDSVAVLLMAVVLGFIKIILIISRDAVFFSQNKTHAYSTCVVTFGEKTRNFKGVSGKVGREKESRKLAQIVRTGYTVRGRRRRRLQQDTSMQLC
jgi:hypothetical protein